MPVNLFRWVIPALAALMIFASFSTVSAASEIDPFVGSYSGEAEFEDAGEKTKRNMNVEIAKTKAGFEVSWMTITHQANGKVKEKQYKIEFVGTTRQGTFSSGMKRDLFGNRVPLNPINGDPYVWSHISGETITVYALNILEHGGYEMQEYKRTLTDGGLDLDYQRIRNGEKLKNIRAFLKRK